MYEVVYENIISYGHKKVNRYVTHRLVYELASTIRAQSVIRMVSLISIFLITL